MFVLLQFPVTCVSSAPMSCPHDYRWHSWKNTTQMPVIIVRLTKTVSGKRPKSSS